MKRLPIFLIIMYVAISCDNRPDYVLSRNKMENVLYDYHLMQGIIDQLPYEERDEKAQDYINAVFAKHNVTEAQFDSSVTYYNRHSKDLHKIYTNLKERYENANEEIQIINGNNEMMAVYAEGGDTTNIWNAAQLLVLRNSRLLNRESYTIHADTSFHRHDQFILTFSPFFTKDVSDNRDQMLNVGINVHYKNGNYSAITRNISSSGTQQLTLKATDDEDIKMVTGFFYYVGKPNSRNFCLVDDIQLVRMHEKPTEVVATADTVAIDTTTLDSLPAERRLSPEERRQQNKSSKQIKIQQAPEVRTPNSIGPRRRVKPANH